MLTRQLQDISISVRRITYPDGSVHRKITTPTLGNIFSDQKSTALVTELIFEHHTSWCEDGDTLAVKVDEGWIE